MRLNVHKIATRSCQHLEEAVEGQPTSTVFFFRNPKSNQFNSKTMSEATNELKSASPSGNEYQLTLQKPALMRIETASNGEAPKQATVDVYRMWRKIVEADKTPTDDARWMAVAKILADALGVQPDLIAESQARLFREAILRAGNNEEQELKNVLGKMLCSPQSSQASQADISIGQENSSERG